jgi:hypothetical protein
VKKTLKSGKCKHVDKTSDLHFAFADLNASNTLNTKAFVLTYLAEPYLSVNHGRE